MHGSKLEIWGADAADKDCGWRVRVKVKAYLDSGAASTVQESNVTVRLDCQSGIRGRETKERRGGVGSHRGRETSI